MAEHFVRQNMMSSPLILFVTEPAGTRECNRKRNQAMSHKYSLVMIELYCFLDA